MQDVFLSILSLPHNMADLKMVWPSHTPKAIKTLHEYMNALTCTFTPFVFKKLMNAIIYEYHV